MRLTRLLYHSPHLIRTQPTHFRTPLTTRHTPLALASSFHTTTRVHTLTRNDIAEEKNVYNIVDRVYAIKDANERNKKLIDIINTVKTFQNPTHKEILVLKAAHVYRGKSYFEMQDQAAALKELEIAEELGVGDERLYYEKGNVLANLGQYASAIRYLTMTINQAGAGGDLNLAALTVRALCYFEISDKNKSLQDINEVLFYEPDNVRAKLERGRYNADSKPVSALRDFKDCMSSPIKEEKGEALFRAGVIYLKTGATTEGEKMFSELEALDPTHPRVHTAKELLQTIKKQSREPFLQSAEKMQKKDDVSADLAQLLKDLKKDSSSPKPKQDVAKEYKDNLSSLLKN